MINYSFIIPHHNCPELLDRCLRSIPQRDDLEIIVVDDNSDIDKQPKIQRADAKVVYIDKEHTKGAGRARNVGVSAAKGKWLLFADADDYYSDNLTELLNKFSSDIETDLVYLNASQFDENGKETRYARTDDLIDKYIKGETYSEMNLRYRLWTPWSRMVKREIVEQNNLLFDELPAGNDVIFGLNCSRYSKTIQVEKSIIYKYFKHSGGSKTDKARERMRNSLFNLIGRHIQIEKEVGYKYRSTFISEFLFQVKNNNITLKQAFKEYRFYLKKYDISVMSDVWNLLNRRLFMR